MEKILVIFEGKEYTILHQYASGFCEIVDVDSPLNSKLVHFSELVVKQ